MYITEFNYHKPKSLEEACKILKENNNATLLAGGTDILVELKKGLRTTDDIISIKNLNELKLITEENNNIIIGSAVTHNEIINSSLIDKNLNTLSDAASAIGTEQIRNTGTIGGNLCTGASCCDMAPVLLAYDSSVEIVSFSESKIIPIKDFFIDHHKTALQKDEILTKIIIPVPGINKRVKFLKFGLRDAAAISVASVAVMIKIENQVCTDSNIAIGAVAPAPKLCNSTKEIIIGLNKTDIIKEDVLQKISEAAVNDALPIDDIRGSADYRRKVVSILTKRAVLEALK